MMKNLETFQTKITRSLSVVITIGLVSIFSVFLFVRPLMVGRLTEEYLKRLGDFVADDIRYVLLVQDPLTTSDYAEDLIDFPWVEAVRILDNQGTAIASVGRSNWLAPTNVYTIGGEVRQIEDQVHLTRLIHLNLEEPDSSDDHLLHVVILDKALVDVIDDILYLMVLVVTIVSLAHLAVSAYLARRAVRVVTQLSVDLQSVDATRGELTPVDLGTDIIELYSVQQSFNALVGRISEHSNELEQRIASRTQDLALTLQQKERGEAIRSSLIMNLSHDLKTPLTASTGFLDHALEELEDREANAADLKHILLRARHYNQILSSEISTLLQYSVTASDLSELSLQPVDMKRLFENAVETVTEMSLAAGNSVDLCYRGRQHFFTAHRLVRHIVDNLLSNANRYCSQGHVVVDCTVEDALNISVSDTGPGIPHEVQERIFRPHFQHSGAESVGPRGMGIGLALTKSWVDHLGGTIRFERVRSKTVFYVTIPGAHT